MKIEESIFIFIRCTSLMLLLSLSSVMGYPDAYDSTTARNVVNSLKMSSFKKYIKGLADCGGREYRTTSNVNGRNYIIQELEKIGYDVSTQSSSYRNVYCTKVGSIAPDSMYIVSAHYDGMPVAEAANDDASGCALVMEGARVFFNPLIKTHYSIRFMLWNAEEKGLLGAKSYIKSRRTQQGNTEPRWLGIIQHDMILYDHGVPPMPNQIPDADIDVEYQKNSTMANASLKLARECQRCGKAYGPKYAVDIGDNMSHTDSDPFKNYIAAVSVRELERISEIGKYADPTWHTRLDKYSYFSEDDFNLGFTTTKMTIGTLCRLAGVHDSIPVGLTPRRGPQLAPLTQLKSLILYDLRGKTVLKRNTLESRTNALAVLYQEQGIPAGLYLVQLIGINNTREQRYIRIAH